MKFLDSLINKKLLNPIGQKLTKLYELFLELKAEKPRTYRSYLIAYHWYNEVTGTRGNSSAVFNLLPEDVLNEDKVKEIQDSLLKAILEKGHPNDPTDIVILGFSLLEG